MVQFYSCEIFCEKIILNELKDSQKGSNFALLHLDNLSSIKIRLRIVSSYNYLKFSIQIIILGELNLLNKIEIVS